MRSASLLRLLAVGFLALLVACGQSQNGDGDGNGNEPIAITDAGFVGPESVYFHEAGDVYFVSNVGSNATGAGDGFISRVNPDGTVADLKWIDGASEGVTMDAPKGMAVVDGLLYVADFSSVRVFDVETGEQTASVEIPGSLFLNDVAPHPDGGVVVTDTAVDENFTPVPEQAAVYRVSADGTVSDYLRDPALAGANGIVQLGTADSYAVVTFGEPGSVIYLENGALTDTVAITEAGNFDGVVELEGGDLLVSSWTTSSILRVSAEGEATTALEGYASPADIGFDTSRDRVLIPLLQENEVHIVPLPAEGAN